MNTAEERKQKRVQNAEVLETFCLEFKERFPTLEACMSALWKLFNLHKVQCTRCGKQLATGSDRSVSCPNCRKKNWVTASTALNNVERPDVWLAIVLLQGSGVPFSSSKLAILLKAANGTVKNARLKIALATTDWMKEEEPHAVSSAEMIAIYDRHSLATPYHQHPRAEQQEMEERARERESVFANMHHFAPPDHSETLSPTKTDEVPGNNECGDSSLDTTGNAVDPKQEVLRLLADGPLHFDILAVKTGLDVGTLNSLLTILELDGEIQSIGICRFASKCVRQSKKTILAPDIRQFIQDFIEFVKTYHHGISRKYVQLYMASYWYHLCRNSFTPIRLTAVWKARGYISSEELKAYISPLDTIVGTLRLNALRVPRCC